MKKKISYIVMGFVIIFLHMSVPAYADIGPKPSVVIDFDGLENKNYYVTLLSEIESTGPHSVLGKHENNQRYHEDDEDYEIWQKFISYKDEDGFYFLQYFQKCTDTSQFKWGYYPPPKFKILLYFPELNSFVVSQEVYERYAFDSYYKVEAHDLKIQSGTITKGITAEKNYDHTFELVSLFIRIIATIVIEVLIALLFGFRTKKQILIIGFTNIITQSILNILLNIINYNQGSMAFVLNYIWMELLIFVIEAVVYNNTLYKYSNQVAKKKWITTVYVLTANSVSFGVGIYIVNLIPGIF